MTLLSIIKNFVSKFIDNPIKTGIVAFLIWRILKPSSSESCEGFQVIKKQDDKELIYDTEDNLYYLVKNGKDIKSFRDKTKALKALNENYDGRIESLYKEVVTPADENKVDPKELEMGIKVEMEHTDDKEEAKKIALQHLAEVPDYYTKLKKHVESEKVQIKERISNLHTGITKILIGG